MRQAGIVGGKRAGGGPAAHLWLMENLTQDLTRPMDEAPTDGTVIEAMFDGTWHRVYYTDRANDMSPVGATGWARADDRMLMVDLDGWREVPEGEWHVIDDEADYANDSMLQATAEAVAADRERARAAQERKSAQQSARASLEAEYTRHTGADAAHMSLTDLRRANARARAEWMLGAIGGLLDELRLR